MSGINLHMTQNSYASAYKPRTDSDGSQAISPTYYAYAAMAQLIGSGNGTTQIARLSSDTMPAAYDDYVRYVPCTLRVCHEQLSSAQLKKKKRIGCHVIGKAIIPSTS